MRKKLTNAFVENIEYRKGGDNTYFDATLPSFALVVGVRTKVWRCWYRLDGVQKKLKLGTFPRMSLKDARDNARTAFEKVDRNEDPTKLDPEAENQLRAAERAVNAKERDDAQRLAFARVAQVYIDRRASERQGRRTLEETKRIIKNVLVEAWGNQRIDEIDRSQINDLLDGIVDRGHRTAARHAFEQIRSIFKWAEQRGYLHDNPVTGMESPTVKVSRSRTLSREEVVKLWAACEQIGYPYGPFVQWMFLSGGQRRHDVATMRWSEITEAKIKKPGQKEPVSIPVWAIEEPTKSERETHVIPISDFGASLIKSLPRFEGEYVFSTTEGRRPISGFSKFKSTLDVVSGVKGWRLHDIRRTVSTMFGDELDLPPHVAEVVQNRRTGQIEGVVATYNRAQYVRTKADALEEWGQFLQLLLADNVVELRRG